MDSEEDDTYWYEDGQVGGFGEDDALAQEAIYGDAKFAEPEPVLSEEFPFGPDVLVLEPTDAQYVQWLAVLCAAGLDYTLVDDADSWLIAVPPEDAESARHQIDEYEAECQYWPPPREDLSPWVGDTGLVTKLMSLALLGFFFFVAPYHAEWLDKGAGDVDSLLGGEWWRAVTALTLHADFGHVASNVVGFWLVGGAVCIYLGQGFGWLLIIGSGAVGNVLNAWYHEGEAYSFIGASTAVFAAFGLLAGLRLWRAAKVRDGRQPLYVPFFTALAIFAMLGMGSGNVDISGHAFGMLAGAAASACGPWLLRLKERGHWQDLALTAVSLLIGLSWWRAY
jgi:membrane associated rhomboid family serine protease